MTLHTAPFDADLIKADQTLPPTYQGVRPRLCRLVALFCSDIHIFCF